MRSLSKFPMIFSSARILFVSLSLSYKDFPSFVFKLLDQVFFFLIQKNLFFYSFVNQFRLYTHNFKLNMHFSSVSQFPQKCFNQIFGINCSLILILVLVEWMCVLFLVCQLNYFLIYQSFLVCQSFSWCSFCCKNDTIFGLYSERDIRLRL
mgnify:CR=1 FL=1